jgi:lysophospholipase L1-like esterase
MGKGETGWADIVVRELESVYGDAIEVSVKSYEMTSLQFIQETKQEELAAEHADLVLLEPFILMNNGYVGNEQAAEHYSVIIQAIKAINSGAVVILQPANPLSKARFYPLQVDELERYAQENEVPYLDHWQAWPETENERLELLAGGDPNLPNEDGHRLWADYLIDYFIAE